MEESIIKEEANVANLRRELKQIKVPRRSIAWQMQNRGIDSTGITRRVLITRRNRAKINTQIQEGESRIVSFRKSVLGV